jgi:GT2 family glycosyltransferase
MSAPRRGPRLAALIVNYRSGAFCVGCVRSLQRDWAGSGFHADDLQIVVVDNASGDSERPYLEILRRRGVRVVTSHDNGGYARGLNLAFEASSGEDGDYVALLNADLWFQSGSLRTLLTYLDSHPLCGAIGPRLWLDEEQTFALPPIALPTSASEVAAELAPLSARLARRRAAQRTEHCLTSWRGTIPHAVSMLSGACMILPREVAQDLGGPMDERYPLYYEDADLARRIQKRGLTTVLHPGAQVVHHWSRSAGYGQEFEQEPRRRFDISRRAYLRRWFGHTGLRTLDGTDVLTGHWPLRRRCLALHDTIDLKACGHPIALELPAAEEVLLELSNDPLFALAAGCITLAVGAGSFR